MKVIFPTDEKMGFLSQRGAHFGKAKFYTMIELQNGEIVDVDTVVNPGHNNGACGNAVQHIMALQPDAMVVSGIGGSP
ncbi:MAG TPA: dinitrogenase iron-molybdenum cofactor biosynthesis protein, partial [Epsilonproteobacteria bacterium]|nr:dinitrogenase iron-molybdenum cofactor biosynthesis protein [Campylobacterota bacterium]